MALTHSPACTRAATPYCAVCDVSYVVDGAGPPRRGTRFVCVPGRLDDGTALDYAWGLGVREHDGQRIHRHGGLWAGLSAQLVRLPDRHSGFVIIALDDDEDRTSGLADALIEELTTGH